MMLVLAFGWMALLGGHEAPSGSGARASSRLEVQ
jgi:hypothetical protein